MRGVCDLAKKKAKTINLTRTVSDLNGRVQELEVEAGELRNENKCVCFPLAIYTHPCSC